MQEKMNQEPSKAINPTLVQFYVWVQHYKKSRAFKGLNSLPISNVEKTKNDMSPTHPV